MLLKLGLPLFVTGFRHGLAFVYYFCVLFSFFCAVINYMDSWFESGN